MFFRVLNKWNIAGNYAPVYLRRTQAKTSLRRSMAHRIDCSFEHDNQSIGSLEVQGFQHVQRPFTTFDVMDFDFLFKSGESKFITGYKFNLGSRIILDNSVNRITPFTFLVRGKVENEDEDSVNFKQEIAIHVPIVKLTDSKSKTVIKIDSKTDCRDYQNLRPSWKKFVTPTGSSQYVLKEMHKISKCEEWKFEGLKFIGIPVISIPKCNRFIMIERKQNGKDLVPIKANYRAFKREKTVHLFVQNGPGTKMTFTVRL